MKAKTFDVRLHEVSLTSVPELTKNDKLLIRYRLVSPRAGTYEIERSQSASWASGKNMDIDDNKLRYWTDGLTLDKQIIFKEKIEGEALLQIEVLAMKMPTRFGSLLISILKGGIEKAFEYFTGSSGLITNDNTKMIMEKINDEWFLGQIEVDEDGEAIQLGTATVAIKEDGTLDLSSEKLKNPNENGTVDLTLKTNAKIVLTKKDVTGSVLPDIHQKKPAHNTHAQIDDEPVFTLKKNKDNGVIKLKISVS